MSGHQGRTLQGRLNYTVNWKLRKESAHKNHRVCSVVGTARAKTLRCTQAQQACDGGRWTQVGRREWTDRLGPEHEGPCMPWWVCGLRLECSGNPLVYWRVLNRGETGSDLTVFEIT